MSAGFRTQDPRTGEVLQRFSTAADEQIDEAVASSAAAYADWSRRGIDERAGIAHRIADLFQERGTELARLAALEMGKPLDQACEEITECVDIFRYYAENGPELAAGKIIADDAERRAVIQHLPLGPLLGIMPWNFPYYQVARFAAPNLVLGNTILLKHAETVPQCALAIETLLHDAGLPAGAYRNVFAAHEQVEQIIADERVHGVSLTGSERAGSAVAALAGKHLKKVVLELGGSDAHIYLQVDDVAAAARQAWEGRLFVMGQACTSNKRLIVHEDYAEEFLAELSRAADELTPGDPLNPSESSCYPLSSVAAADQVREQIARAVEQGAVLHAGGERPETPGAWLRPAVISGVTEEMDLYREEVFGPVAVVWAVPDEKAAVRLANDSPYGLAGAVFSADQEQALRVAQQLEVGMANVNVAGSEMAEMPFGGVKRSGFGRELGPLGMDEFANKRLLYVNR
ncbi:NAD-dependent succinate-semialdehyde dehydrogenase [Nesterenkonia populi]